MFRRSRFCPLWPWILWCACASAAPDHDHRTSGTPAAPGVSESRDASNRLPGAPPSVELVIVPSPAQAKSAEVMVASLGQRLAGWFRSTGVDTTCRHEAELDPEAVLQPTGQSGVRVWLLFSDATSNSHPGSAHLYFAVERPEAQGLRFLWRTVELKSGLDELGGELLAQVIRLSSVALWEGSLETSREQLTEQLGRERVVVPFGSSAASSARSVGGDASIPAPVDLARATAVRPRWVSPVVRIIRARISTEPEGTLVPALGIGYLMRWRGPEDVASGPEMMLGFGVWSHQSALGVRASWQSLSTQLIARDQVEFEVGGNALRVVGHATKTLPRGVELTGELGCGLDVIRYRTTRIADSRQEMQSDPHDLRPLVYLGTGVQRQLGLLRLGLSALLAVQVRHTRYGVMTEERFQPLMVPWRVQPGVRLELSWQ
jgi:hypothetical protein